jgi:hypothetical protein
MIDIGHPTGLPRWFARLHHWIAVRHCNQYGHTPPGTAICAHCGQVFNRDIAIRAGVRL